MTLTHFFSQLSIIDAKNRQKDKCIHILCLSIAPVVTYRALTPNVYIIPNTLIEEYEIFLTLVWSILIHEISGEQALAANRVSNILNSNLKHSLLSTALQSIIDMYIACHAILMTFLIIH